MLFTIQTTIWYLCVWTSPLPFVPIPINFIRIMCRGLLSSEADHLYADIHIYIFREKRFYVYRKRCVRMATIPPHWSTDSISIAMCYATKKPISDSNSDALVSIGILAAGIANSNSNSNNMAGNYTAWNYLWWIRDIVRLTCFIQTSRDENKMR